MFNIIIFSAQISILFFVSTLKNIFGKLLLYFIHACNCFLKHLYNVLGTSFLDKNRYIY